MRQHRNRAAGNSQARHIIAGDQFNLRIRNPLPCHGEFAQHIAGADGGWDGAVVGDGNVGGLAPAFWHGQRQRLAADEGDVGAGAQVDGGVFDDFVAGEEGDVFEIRKAPAHQPDAFLDAVLRGWHAVQHHDDAAAAVFGATDDTEAAGVGVAGFQAVRQAALHERIAVVLDNAVVGKRLFRVGSGNIPESL